MSLRANSGTTGVPRPNQCATITSAWLRISAVRDISHLILLNSGAWKAPRQTHKCLCMWCARVQCLSVAGSLSLCSVLLLLLLLPPPSSRTDPMIQIGNTCAVRLFCHAPQAWRAFRSARFRRFCHVLAAAAWACRRLVCPKDDHLQEKFGGGKGAVDLGLISPPPPPPRPIL